MKKVISAIIACVFLMAVASSVAVTSFAAISPIAPTIDETTTKTPPTEKPTEKPSEEPSEKPSETPSEPPSKPDVDETTTDIDESTTKKPVTSDTNPSSPDTGSHVGKPASAAAVVALALGGAVVYTSKKKAE